MKLDLAAHVGHSHAPAEDLAGGGDPGGKVILVAVQCRRGEGGQLGPAVHVQRCAVHSRVQLRQLKERLASQTRELGLQSNVLDRVPQARERDLPLCQAQGPVQLRVCEAARYLHLAVEGALSLQLTEQPAFRLFAVDQPGDHRREEAQVRVLSACDDPQRPVGNEAQRVPGERYLPVHEYLLITMAQLEAVNINRLPVHRDDRRRHQLEPGAVAFGVYDVNAPEQVRRLMRPGHLHRQVELTTDGAEAGGYPVPLARQVERVDLHEHADLAFEVPVTRGGYERLALGRGNINACEVPAGELSPGLDLRQLLPVVCGICDLEFDFARQARKEVRGRVFALVFVPLASSRGLEARATGNRGQLAAQRHGAVHGAAETHREPRQLPVKRRLSLLRLGKGLRYGLSGAQQPRHRDALKLDLRGQNLSVRQAVLPLHRQVTTGEADRGPPEQQQLVIEHYPCAHAADLFVPQHQVAGLYLRQALEVVQRALQIAVRQVHSATELEPHLLPQDQVLEHYVLCAQLGGQHRLVPDGGDAGAAADDRVADLRPHLADVERVTVQSHHHQRRIAGQGLVARVAGEELAAAGGVPQCAADLGLEPRGGLQIELLDPGQSPRVLVNRPRDTQPPVQLPVPALRVNLSDRPLDADHQPARGRVQTVKLDCVQIPARPHGNSLHLVVLPCRLVRLRGDLELRLLQTARGCSCQIGLPAQFLDVKALRHICQVHVRRTEAQRNVALPRHYPPHPDIEGGVTDLSPLHLQAVGIRLHQRVDGVNAVLLVRWLGHHDLTQRLRLAVLVGGDDLAVHGARDLGGLLQAREVLQPGQLKPADISSEARPRILGVPQVQQGVAVDARAHGLGVQVLQAHHHPRHRRVRAELRQLKVPRGDPRDREVRVHDRIVPGPQDRNVHVVHRRDLPGPRELLRQLLLQAREVRHAHLRRIRLRLHRGLGEVQQLQRHLQALDLRPPEFGVGVADGPGQGGGQAEVAVLQRANHTSCNLHGAVYLDPRQVLGQVREHLDELRRAHRLAFEAQLQHRLSEIREEAFGPHPCRAHLSLQTVHLDAIEGNAGCALELHQSPVERLHARACVSERALAGERHLGVPARPRDDGHGS